MAKNSEPNKEEVVNHQVDSRIAAVRDLIFGENIQQYDSEFSDIYEKIKQLKESTKNNLSDAVNNLDNQLTEQKSSSADELSKAISHLENKLADLESLMDHKIQDLQDDLDKKLADLDDEKTDRRKLGKALEKIAMMLQE